MKTMMAVLMALMVALASPAFGQAQGTIPCALMDFLDQHTQDGPLTDAFEYNAALHEDRENSGAGDQYSLLDEFMLSMNPSAVDALGSHRLYMEPGDIMPWTFRFREVTESGMAYKQIEMPIKRRGFWCHCSLKWEMLIQPKNTVRFVWKHDPDFEPEHVDERFGLGWKQEEVSPWNAYTSQWIRFYPNYLRLSPDTSAEVEDDTLCWVAYYITVQEVDDPQEPVIQGVLNVPKNAAVLYRVIPQTEDDFPNFANGDIESRISGDYHVAAMDQANAHYPIQVIDPLTGEDISQ